MKCPKCERQLHYRGVMHTCGYNDCKYEIDYEDFENLQARAEKAEGELKAIKVRIEEIAEFAKTIAAPYKSELIHNILELQKQIGGAK